MTGSYIGSPSKLVEKGTNIKHRRNVRRHRQQLFNTKHNGGGGEVKLTPCRGEEGFLSSTSGAAHDAPKTRRQKKRKEKGVAMMSYSTHRNDKKQDNS